MDDDDIVEVRGAPAAPRPEPPRDEPLLDLGTKIALFFFVLAVLGGVAAIVVSVAFF